MRSTWPPDDPIVRDLKIARALTGLSGFRVLLATRDGRRWFVRKAAPQPDVNARLRVQLAKQQHFEQHLQSTVRVPQILEAGELEGRFYFDMEFIRGRDAISFIQQARYDEIVRFSDHLSEYVKTAASMKPVLPSNGLSFFSALYLKLCEIQRRTGGAIPEATCGRLFMGLERLFHLDQLPPTLCHGDFTLENTIVDDEKRIYVLDLLDAPFEHYWQDLAKLQQDVAGGWYTRHQPAISHCVLDYVRRRLQDTGAELHPEYTRAHPILMASIFARILPYAKTAADRAFVLERIEHFAGELE